MAIFRKMLQLLEDCGKNLEKKSGKNLKQVARIGTMWQNRKKITYIVKITISCLKKNYKN